MKSGLRNSVALFALFSSPAFLGAGEPITDAIAAVAAAGSAKAGANAAQIQRGAFMVQVGGCNDCHTPWKLGPNGPEPDLTRMLSGHPQDLVMPPVPQMSELWNVAFGATFTAAAGPWGVSFTRNLTPDPDTGLGMWTEAEFIATLRSGRTQGRGRELLPPMPWPPLSTLPEEDLKALWAFLRNLPPVVNKVPDPLPPPTPPPAK